MKVCIVGASGKLGRYMVRHALDREYEVVDGREVVEARPAETVDAARPVCAGGDVAFHLAGSDKRLMRTTEQGRGEGVGDRGQRKPEAHRDDAHPRVARELPRQDEHGHGSDRESNDVEREE